MSEHPLKYGLNLSQKKQNMSKSSAIFNQTQLHFSSVDSIESESKFENKRVSDPIAKEKSLQGQLFDLKRDIKTTSNQIKGDISKIRSDKLIEGLKVDEIIRTEQIIHEISWLEPGPLQRMFVHKEKETLAQDLLEGKIRDEYRSGVTDPTRMVAKYEKSQNKKLRIQRQEVKRELIKTNYVMGKLGM